jgi:hypothetical protein
MAILSHNRIILKRHNWELPALVSLVAAIVASLYALAPSSNPCGIAAILCFSLLSGVVSIIKQVVAARATIVSFGESDWVRIGDDLVLEIQSNFMLFRVETRKDSETIREVMGSVETSEDGRVTRICFAGSTSKEHLAGRVVVR